MKQFALLIGLFFCTSLLMAQRNAVVASKKQNSSFAAQRTLACEDTLGLCAYRASNKALYKDQLGGYAAGTNYFGDLAKAQQFDFADTVRYNIRKVLFYFGAKKTVVPDSFLIVSIYKIDSLGYAAGNTTRACPDTILASRKLYLDSIDTIAGNPTIVNFEWGVSTRGSFAVGFDMSHLDTADRVGLYSTKDSSANKTELAWEKQNNGRWYTMLRSWPLDIDFAIFPIVDKTAIGIIENKSGLADLNFYPNPSNDFFEISFTTKSAKQLEVQIVDALGQIVYKTALSLHRRRSAKICVVYCPISCRIIHLFVKNNRRYSG